MGMKRLMVMLVAGLTMLALGACGKQETKPQDAATTDKNMMEQSQPADAQKPADDKATDATQQPSAQADQYNGMAQASAEQNQDQDQDQNNQS